MTNRQRCEIACAVGAVITMALFLFGLWMAQQVRLSVDPLVVFYLTMCAIVVWLVVADVCQARCGSSSDCAERKHDAGV